MGFKDTLLHKSKNILLLTIGIAIASGMLAFFYEYSQRSQAAIDHPVEFFFTPAKRTADINKEITVDIQASTNQPISIATVLVRFPSSILTLNVQKTLTSADSSCSSLETGVDVREIKGSNGYSTLVLTRAAKKSTSVLPKNAFCFGRLYFTTKQAGKGTITFQEQAVDGWTFDIAGPNGTYFAAFGTGDQEVDITVTGTAGSDNDAHYKIFATSKSYSGKFTNGTAGADAICQQHADDADLDGDWFAFLSTRQGQEYISQNAFDRISHPNIPMYLLNGDVIASDLNDLKTCNPAANDCVQNPISVNEFGETLFKLVPYVGGDGGIQVIPQNGATNLFAWTGTLINNTTNPYEGTETSCNNWTSTQGQAIIGALYSTDKSWVSYDGKSCGEQYRLYCFSYSDQKFEPVKPPGSTTPPPGTITKTPSDDNDDNGDSDKPGNVSVNYRVRLQGITNQPKNSSPIQIQFKLVEGNKVIDTKQVSFSPQADGAYVANTSYSNISPSKKYSLLVKGPKHIQKRICTNSPSENVSGTYKCKDSEITFKTGDNTLDFTNIVLLSGDLPLQNGIVDAVDIAYIRNNIGKSDADIVARADLNFDGVVDTQDYTLIINALAFKYDE